MIPKLHSQNRVPLIIPNQPASQPITHPDQTQDSRIKIKIKNIQHPTPSLTGDNHRRNHFPRPSALVRRNAIHPLRLGVRIDALLGRQKDAGVPVLVEGVQVLQG